MKVSYTKHKMQGRKIMNQFLIVLLLLFSLWNCGDQNDPTSKNGKDGKTANALLNSNQNVQPVVPKAEYTQEAPGEWQNIAKDHLIDFAYDPTSSQINIQVKGDTFDEGHYIEKIGLMDSNKADITTRTFDRGSIPSVSFNIDSSVDITKVKIYAKCNLHDLWTMPMVKPEGEKKK